MRQLVWRRNDVPNECKTKGHNYVLIIWYILPKQFKDLIVRLEVVYGIASAIIENTEKIKIYVCHRRN